MSDIARHGSPAVRSVIGLTLLLAAVLARSSAPLALRQAAPAVKALVDGTLIDGYGGRPVRNSVVLISGDRISAVGQVGALAVPIRDPGSGIRRT